MSAVVSTRARTTAALLLASALLSACSAESSPADEGAAPAPGTTASGGAPATDGATADAPAADPSAASPSPKAPDRPTTVVGGRDLQALSVSVTQQLFEAAPVVVVADASDQASVDEAAAQATELGAPLLLAQPASASTSQDALTEELDRLGASTVLAVGEAASGLESTEGRAVATDPAELPASAPAQGGEGGQGVTVLVRGDGGPVVQRGAAAATASAQAAGARVVTVQGTDPRADSEAIAALAQEAPETVLAVGGFGPADRLEQRLAVAATGAELPGGGQVLFPGRTLVALYGHPGTGSLGVLGEQDLDASIQRAKEVAATYDAHSEAPVVPTFELIATVAHGSPGSDGNYSGESSIDRLRPWVEKAGEEGVYVILDLQPGRADFLAQAKLYEPLLKLPHVGLALDPEWKLGPGQVPLGQIGGVDAEEVNRVTSWLADLTARERLPQKIVVLHQFRLSMLRDPQDIDTSRDEVSLLIHMDGQGAPDLKDATWRAVVPAAPEGMNWWGWKNFYDEDTPTMTPQATMAKRPQPVMISYQ